MAAAPAPAGEPGTITTFYSYKGGTGRTMALANSAIVLAERLAPGEKVLVVDWDLEAPGLHRYFPPRLRGSDPAQDMGLDAGPGLIDLFIALSDHLPAEPAGDLAQADAAVEQAVAALDWAAYIGQTEHAAVHIMRAGRNDDGGYGRRVNTFAWERLFERAPGIYRAFAERLAREYRWVLIDSRTGVTDISGICTSLLPEKLVVVFTPNRQSLTGVRELVRTATAYRRGGDDLRPLLVLPLPSRIEASMEKLRIHWRHGRPEDGITGYQPMFQSLLAECYDLAECDLGAYFDAVQIQQSPDCAYGEVISVRSGSGDRFSLASSYRVFVDRLMAPTPPWEPLDRIETAYRRGTLPAETVPSTQAPRPTATDFDPFSPADPLPHAPSPAAPGAQPQAPPSPASLDGDPFLDITLAPAPRPPAPASSASEPHLLVFLSYASEDRERVDVVARLLKSRGFGVFDPRDLQPGKRWDDQIAESLDRADAVVVFWSQSAFASESVRVEAEEGQRRGVLLPVLLDDARSPISFRGLQAADLRRDFEAQLPGLLEDIARIARAAPGDRTLIVPGGSYAPPTYAPSMPVQAAPARHAPGTPAATSAPAGRAGRRYWLPAALAALVLLAGALWWLSRQATGGSTPTPVYPPNPGPAVPARTVTVPDLKDRLTSVAGEIASSLKLRLVAVDEQGQSHEPPPDGLVLDQSPAAGTQVTEGAVVTLKVAIQTATVPSVGGLSLDEALARMRGAGLDLGKVESIMGSGARAGTVVRQAPQAGTVVPQGTKVGVGVAVDARPARAMPKQDQAQYR
ncbi:MAG: TIR domain-containing protein [Burkholderiales bacterium]|nr:TIR domain-containing protein [Burkholderiales bacterium]